MNTAAAFLSVFAIIYTGWNLITFLFATGRRKSKLKRAGIGFLAMIACGTVGTIAANSEAQKAGFENSTDMAEAKRAGVTDPAVWKAQRASFFAQQRIQDAKNEGERSAREEQTRQANQEAAKAAAEKEAALRVETERAAAQKAKAEEVECRQDLKCWGERAWGVGTYSCIEPIQRLAKWDYEWTDSWSEPKFSKYRWKDQEHGIVTIIGDKLKLQNGFGAWKHVTYSCDVDPVSESVLSVEVH